MVHITSVHHELQYSLRADVAPVCNVKIEYWEHMDDEEDERETEITVRFFGHSLSLFFPRSLSIPLTGRETRRLLREAAQATFPQGLTIKEGLDDEISEHEITVSFKTSRRELPLLDFRLFVTCFGVALDRGIGELVN